MPGFGAGTDVESVRPSPARNFIALSTAERLREGDRGEGPLQLLLDVDQLHNSYWTLAEMN